MVTPKPQIATDIAEELLQRIQAAGYELQQALPLVGDDARKFIESAVERLNDAVKAVHLAAADFSALENR